MNAPQHIATANGQKAVPQRRKKKKFSLAFHQFSRAAHAYLSAFAFLALIFFSASGLLLNHPTWLSSNTVEAQATIAQLDMNALNTALAASNRAQAIATLAAERLPISGTYDSGELFDDEAYLRFAGMFGVSDVMIDLTAGTAEYRTKRFGLVEIMHNLHRGKKAGVAWSLVIDISAVIILVLSLFGFFLFILMRWRRRASLGLIALSLMIMTVILVITP